MATEEDLLVKSCCCFDLKTGGLILSYIGMFASVMSILYVLTIPDHSVGYYVIPDASCVYGIHKQKPKYMRPSMVLCFLGASIAFVVFVRAFVASLIVFVVYLLRYDDSNSAEIFAIWADLVILGVSAALCVYFANVMTSLHKVMTAEEEQATIESCASLSTIIHIDWSPSKRITVSVDPV